MSLETDHPGTIALMVEAARPFLIAYETRIRDKYRPRMIAIIAAELTSDEAAEVEAFYRSPIGRRVLNATIGNQRQDAVAEAIEQGREVTSRDVRSDILATERAAIGSLSAAERAQLARETTAKPALAKLQSLIPRFAAVRVEMEAEPLSAAEEEGYQQALEMLLRPILDSPTGVPAQG